MKSKISNYLQRNMAGITVEALEQMMEVPPEQELGDLAMPCFALAKVLRKIPK